MNPIINPERDAALRDHLDYILLDYALEHICIDHLEWTESKVSDVSFCSGS